MEPDAEGNEPDLQDGVRAAVDEAARIDRGDMLIFMPTEQDIHATAKTLRSRPLPGDATGRETEILPLYARLAIEEQQRVFQPRRQAADHHCHERGRVVAHGAAASAS